MIRIEEIQERLKRKFLSDRCWYCREFHDLKEHCQAESDIEWLLKEVGELQKENDQLKLDMFPLIDKSLLTRRKLEGEVIQAARESSCCSDWNMRHDCGRRELNRALEALDQGEGK